MKMKKLTLNWLKKHEACKEAVKEFGDQKGKDVMKLLKRMIDSKRSKYLDWANWLIYQLLVEYKQEFKYKAYASDKGALIGLATIYPGFSRERPTDVEKIKILEYGIKLLEE